MSNLIISQATKLGEAFNMGGTGQELIQVLKATAFKGDVSDAQMAALMVVANQYHLNPFTKEIYAFPDKQNGIVPVVGVDGWSRIINQHPQFDGMEFRQSEDMAHMPGAKNTAPEWMECVMYRKDRGHPVVVREYLDEVYREPFKGKYGLVIGPWQTHTKRFLRHKTMIQCARLAFGFVGIYDDDEADRIVEAQEARHMGPVEVVKPETYPDSDFEKNLSVWAKAVATGKITLDAMLAKVQTKGSLTTEQLTELHTAISKEKSSVAGAQDVEPKPAIGYAQVADALHKANTQDALDDAADLIAARRTDQDFQ